MSYGKPDDRALSTSRFHRLMANADADRAARSAGRKSPFRHLLDRLRPHCGWADYDHGPGEGGGRVSGEDRR